MSNFSSRKLVAVNMNLPEDLVNRVKKYANELGLPFTQTYILLLNNALEQNEVMKTLPELLISLKKFNDNKK